MGISPQHCRLGVFLYPFIHAPVARLDPGQYKCGDRIAFEDVILTCVKIHALHIIAAFFKLRIVSLPAAVNRRVLLFKNTAESVLLVGKMLIVSRIQRQRYLLAGVRLYAQCCGRGQIHSDLVLFARIVPSCAGHMVKVL